VLNTIGRTRLIPLQHIVPEESARILVKLEYENPTGSMKDRMALAMVEAAEADGRLRPGGSVVEYTGGSTGVSLAFVCAAFGFAGAFASSVRWLVFFLLFFIAVLRVRPHAYGHMSPWVWSESKAHARECQDFLAFLEGRSASRCDGRPERWIGLPNCSWRGKRKRAKKNRGSVFGLRG